MKYFLSFILSLCIMQPLFSQEGLFDAKPYSMQTSSALETEKSAEADLKPEKEYYEGGFMSHLNVSLRFSTMGLGLELATPLNSYFKLRAGVNYMGYKREEAFNVSLDDPDGYFQEAIGYVPDFRTTADINFTNGHVLFDFHPVKKGIFHITAGAFVGKNKLTAKGFLADSDGNPSELLDPDGQWPTIDFDGHVIEPVNGKLDIALQLGQVVKPYFGFGLGRAISRSRVSFMFELGAIYQGNYSLTQNGKKIDTSGIEGSESFQDAKTYTQILKWWPMMNFQLTYRIF